MNQGYMRLIVKAYQLINTFFSIDFIFILLILNFIIYVFYTCFIYVLYMFYRIEF